MRIKVSLFRQSFPDSILHVLVKTDKHVDSDSCSLSVQDILFKERFNSPSQYHEDIFVVYFHIILAKYIGRMSASNTHTHTLEE